MSVILLTVREVATRWRRSQGWVRDQVKAGKLKAVKLSERGMRIAEPDADAHLIEQVFKSDEPAEIDPATKAARREMASKMGKASAAARAARRVEAASAATPLPKVKKVKCKPASVKGGGQ